MKIYTEEQVNDAIGWYVKLKIKLKKDVTIQEAFNRLTPIELPNDEEITDKALEVGYTNNLFTLGAKWLRDKIQGGNK
jgi:hypothetical protein